MAQLDDDALFGGIEGGQGDDPNAVNVAGILSHDYGSDGPGTTLLTAEGAVLPVGFTASVNAEGTVLTIHQVSTNLDVLQVSLSNTTDGSYTVTQLNPVSQPAGGDENNLQFSINYVVTDGNGDQRDGIILDRCRRRHSECGRDRYDGGGDRTGREPGCSGRRRHRVCDGGLLGQLCGGDGLWRRRCWQRAYSLVLTGSNVASGLFALDAADTDAGDGDGIGQGAQIVLNQVRQRDHRLDRRDQLLHIQINPATGVVTFTRVANIWHGDTSNHDDPETLTLSDPALLRLVQTVTDADGDTDTAALDLGAGVFTIEDDGPDAVVVINTPDTLVLDESPAGQDEGGDFAPAGLNTVSANFADNFGLLPNFGTDGPSSATYSLVLTGSNVASGLFALGVNGAQGASIVLNKVWQRHSRPGRRCDLLHDQR